MFNFIVRRLMTISNRSKFRKFGKGSVILGRCRIDGGKNISIAKMVSISNDVWLYAKNADGTGASLELGEGCVIGAFNHITCIKKVVFGRNVLTANNVYVSDNIHGYEDINTPVKDQPVLFKGEVSIGDGSWLGENVCVIGAKIGKHCVIGANAVVTRDIPDYSVAAGIPARVIKRYNKDKTAWEKV